MSPPIIVLRFKPVQKWRYEVYFKPIFYLQTSLLRGRVNEVLAFSSLVLPKASVTRRLNYFLNVCLFRIRKVASCQAA